MADLVGGVALVVGAEQQPLLALVIPVEVLLLPSAAAAVSPWC